MLALSLIQIWDPPTELLKAWLHVTQPCSVSCHCLRAKVPVLYPGLDPVSCSILRSSQARVALLRRCPSNPTPPGPSISPAASPSSWEGQSHPALGPPADSSLGAFLLCYSLTLAVCLCLVSPLGPCDVLYTQTELQKHRRIKPQRTRKRSWRVLNLTVNREKLDDCPVPSFPGPQAFC